jgi:hypothetical protein
LLQALAQRFRRNLRGAPDDVRHAAAAGTRIGRRFARRAAPETDPLLGDSQRHCGDALRDGVSAAALIGNPAEDVDRSVGLQGELERRLAAAGVAAADRDAPGAAGRWRVRRDLRAEAFQHGGTHRVMDVLAAHVGLPVLHDVVLAQFERIDAQCRRHEIDVLLPGEEELRVARRPHVRAGSGVGVHGAGRDLDVRHRVRHGRIAGLAGVEEG